MYEFVVAEPGSCYKKDTVYRDKLFSLENTYLLLSLEMRDGICRCNQYFYQIRKQNKEDNNMMISEKLLIG